MKIIIALTNTTGKNIAFVTDDLAVRMLDEVVKLVENGLIIGVHVVNSEHGPYVRADRNDTEADNLDFISIQIEKFFKELKSEAQSQATKLYEKLHGSILELGSSREELIYIDGHARALKKDVLEKIKSLAQQIKDAAKTYDIDPSILGAILIDEFVRASIDDAADILGRFGVSDTSVGLAQVKMSTAREIIKEGYYKSASADISDADLYKLLANDKTSVAFAAARIRMIIDYWKDHADLSNRAEIIGTLYSQSLGKPKKDPKPIPRGKKVKGEFQPLAIEALK